MLNIQLYYYFTSREEKKTLVENMTTATSTRSIVHMAQNRIRSYA